MIGVVAACASAVTTKSTWSLPPPASTEIVPGCVAGNRHSVLENPSSHPGPGVVAGNWKNETRQPEPAAPSNPADRRSSAPAGSL
jgi:hypothetical protein